MLPVLTGKSKAPLHESLYWDGAEEKTAVRSGRWKLVNNRGKTELFDLEQDLSEKNDLSVQKPEIVARLRQKFDEWSKANAPRIGKGGANDEDEGGGKRNRAKKSKATQ